MFSYYIIAVPFSEIKVSIYCLISQNFYVPYNMGHICESQGSMNGIEIVVEGRTGKSVLNQGYPNISNF